MCNFFSAIGMRDGSLLWHWMLDSHSDILKYFNVSDLEDYQSRFVKLELVPRANDWLEPDKWNFRIDEDAAPLWAEDASSEFRAKMVAIVSRQIIQSPKTMILEGFWIVGGDARIADVRGGRILRVQDSAQIHDVRDSAQVRDVRDSAQVHGVGGSAQVHGVGGSAQIHGVRDSAQIHGVWDSAQIHGVWDSAQVHGVWDSAQVHGVWDSAQVHGVGGAAQVHGVGGSAQVHDVGPNVILDDSAKAHLVGVKP